MESVLTQKGFEIIENVYSKVELNDIIQLIESKEIGGKFGVREFLVDNPDIADKIFTKKLLSIIKSISPNRNKSIKSIYFDKPPNANWIVNWHQDLTINLTNRREVTGFKNWRTNQVHTVVQPSRKILERIFTIRVHLDDCTKENGALGVIENSHKNGIIEVKDWISHKTGIEKICEVKAGGTLMMKPLILHSSRRTENQKNRRVIHIEFTDSELPNGLRWKEKMTLFKTKILTS